MHTLTPIRSWLDACSVYTRPKVLSMTLLGFAAGLPYLLVFSTLSAWLRDIGVGRTVIGFFSWIGITYSIKFIWAPVIDRLPIPLLTRYLGRRRSWILLGQIGIALGLFGMALTDPQQALLRFALLAMLVAFASATQDVSLDAYRVELVTPDLQGAMAAAYVFGYRVALLVAGAGALYIAEFQSWPIAYSVMAALMVIGMLTVLCMSEPESKPVLDMQQQQKIADYLANKQHLSKSGQRFYSWVIETIVCPFTEFFERNGKLALWILLLIGIYKLSDITMGVMANPFYLDMGYSKQDIANIGKVYGFFMTIGGAVLGGLLVARFGVLPPLLLGAILVAGTNGLFAWLATQEPQLLWLAIVISADNLSGGIATTVFIAYLSSLTNVAYTATQYALFSSLMTLPAKLLGGLSGIVVDGYGYVWFFIYAAALGIPAIFLVLWLLQRATTQAVDGLVKN